MTRIAAPVRACHTYTQHLDGTSEDVFPLLCPVREIEWVPGWQPGVVHSKSGVAERDCIFTTTEAEREAIWTVLEHDVTRGVVEMLKVTPGYLVTRLRITLTPHAAGGTLAAVTYTYTALGSDGAQYVETRTWTAYEEFMRAWEASLNRYLRARPTAAVSEDQDPR